MIDMINAIAAIGHNNPPLSAVLNEQYTDLIKEVASLTTDAKTLLEPYDDASCAVASKILKRVAAIAKKCEEARVNEKEPHLAAGREVDGFFRKISDDLSKTKMPIDKMVSNYLRRKADEERRQREEQARIARELAEHRLREAEALEQANKPASSKEALNAAICAERQATAAESGALASYTDLSRTRTGGITASLSTAWDFEILDFNKVDLEALRPYLPRSSIETAIRSLILMHKGDKPIAGVRIFQTSKARVY